ncbi:MAG: cyclophilin-like fold protein [Nitrososphaeraceae archaeon]|nr:cyclophilin-like fold protein [Nitrososphaeraceae archaeon]
MSYELDLIFEEFDNKIKIILLDNNSSTEIIRRIIEKLPLTTYINKWGEEIYTDDIKIGTDFENSDLKQEVEKFDVAFWPEGGAICLFFGPTPISKGGKILPYSPVQVIGKIKTSNEIYTNVLKFEKRTRITIRKT